MNSPINDLVGPARVKALAIIAGLLILGLSPFVAGYFQSDDSEADKREDTNKAARAGQVAPNTITDAPVADEIKALAGELKAETAIPVKFIAPELHAPAGMVQTKAKSLDQQQKGTSESKPIIEAKRLVNINKEQPITNAAVKPPADVVPGIETTNKAPALAIEVDYTWEAVLQTIEKKRGELMAVCSRPGAPPSLFVLRIKDGRYQLHNSSSADLSNLGLRLHPTDGDLPGIQQNLLTQGFQAITFYFAPAEEMARSILKVQQTAVAKARSEQPSRISESIVLRGRFSSSSNGAPMYSMVNASFPDGTTVQLQSIEAVMMK